MSGVCQRDAPERTTLKLSVYRNAKPLLGISWDRHRIGPLKAPPAIAEHAIFIDKLVVSVNGFAIFFLPLCLFFGLYQFGEVGFKGLRQTDLQSLGFVQQIRSDGQICGFLGCWTGGHGGLLS